MCRLEPLAGKEANLVIGNGVNPAIDNVTAAKASLRLGHSEAPSHKNLLSPLSSVIILTKAISAGKVIKVSIQLSTSSFTRTSRRKMVYPSQLLLAGSCTKKVALDKPNRAK